MFRQPLLPRACLALALGIVVLARPDPALSQDRSTEERLDRLERDLNMLQRQVYRGAPSPTTGGGDEAVNVEIRMERLETQMRDLTGRVEELANRVDQVRQRIEQVNGDVDVRLGQTPPGSGSVAASAPPPPAPPGAAQPADSGPFPPADGPSDELTPPGGAPPPPRPADGGPRPIFGTLTPPGSTPPAALASAPPAAGMLPSGSATEQYNYAFGLLKRADYPAAEAALKAFVVHHPKDALAGNAQFWLGETYYTRARFLEAASAFAEGYKRYPKSPKAADDLLKLAMSLARANEKQNACLALTQLHHDFPHPGAAVGERAAAEHKRLGC